MNVTDKEPIAYTLQTRFSRRPISAVNNRLAGLESILGVMGPLALAAMVSLPFVAPAAAALVPLASLSSMFGRRRRHLDGDFVKDADVLMRRLHEAVLRRD
ncbi:hypothetical protein JTE90_026127 [Oedothorax gibbosus]|uniref:Uncharacterized protein n=1 Tax=Oedothorax gibbosus TaxID=931172 RepID=A0AAV6UZV8_9ARAC|nr:hypothetical protein JTE90_026127 [Oedothorax gibbosus]